MSTGMVVLSIAILAILIVVFYYNSFISKRNMAEQAFSTIDVMLKKRCDLIPNLVATVQQYMKHESGTLTRIAELRGRAADSDADANSRVAANNEMNKLLGGIMVQVENYPDLKANQNFTQLQNSLNNMEEQLSAARRAFNAAVVGFNTSIEMFPGNLVAGLFGFKRKDVLVTDPEDRKVPDVKALFNS